MTTENKLQPVAFLLLVLDHKSFPSIPSDIQSVQLVENSPPVAFRGSANNKNSATKCKLVKVVAKSPITAIDTKQ